MILAKHKKSLKENDNLREKLSIADEEVARLDQESQEWQTRAESLALELSEARRRAETQVQDRAFVRDQIEDQVGQLIFPSS